MSVCFKPFKNRKRNKNISVKMVQTQSHSAPNAPIRKPKKNERKENFSIRCVLWLMVAGVVANTCLFVFRMVSLSFIFHLVFFYFCSGFFSVRMLYILYYFIRSCFSLIRWSFSVKLYALLTTPFQLKLIVMWNVNEHC